MSGTPLSPRSSDDFERLSDTDRGKRFKNVLIDFFSWPSHIAPKDGADVFYKFGRNPMAHALGLDVPDAPEIGINKGPLSERRILELEDAAELAGVGGAGAPAAGRRLRDRRRWPLLGLHRLLRSLFVDKNQSDAAEALAHHLYF